MINRILYRVKETEGQWETQDWFWRLLTLLTGVHLSSHKKHIPHMVHFHQAKALCSLLSPIKCNM